MLALLSFIGILGKETQNSCLNREVDILSSLLKVQGGTRQFSVLYSSQSADIVTKIQQNIQLPSILNSFQTPKREEVEDRYPTSTVLILDENLTLDFALNVTIRNHETAFIAMCKMQECVLSRMREFWQSKIISAYVLLDDETCDVKLFGFEPTPDDVKILPRKEIKLVDLFDMHGSRMNISVVNLAPAVILNPNDDTVTDGVEGRLMLEIARKFNVRSHFAMPRDGEWWGWIHPKATGVVGEVISEYSDFGFGVLAITDSRLKVMDQLAGYNPMECVTWAVPKGAGPTAAPWVAILLTEFSQDTWTAMAGSSLAIILASFVVEKLRVEATIFRIFASAIGSPINLPVNSSSRILMLTWIWSSFILAVAYTASMGSKLAVPPTNPDINTFQDLVDSTLNITGFYNTLRLMTAEDPIIQEIRQRSFATTATIAEAIARIVEKRDIAYMRQSTTFRYNAIVDPESQEDIHIMKDCAFTYYPSINMAKWSPFYRGAQNVVSRLFESGIVALWGSRLMPELPPLPKPVTALGLGKVLGAFSILGVGVGLASVTFAVEFFLGPRPLRKTPNLEKANY